MSAYLKRMNIADVDDTGESLGAYRKRVHIVEVVDSEGNPWNPDVPQIGDVTIDPEQTAVNSMDSKTFSVVVTGGDATDLTYKWSVRSGDGEAIFDSPDDQTSATFIFIRSGSVTIQCSVSSATANNSPQSNISFVIVN